MQHTLLRRSTAPWIHTDSPLMTVYSIDPLQDPRWQELVNQHADASVFHSPAWMRALKECYGYEFGALTTAAPSAPLEDGLPFCRITSWLTGSRIVSLPFADHCQPLAADMEGSGVLLQAFQKLGAESPWKYTEVRPLQPLHDEGKGSDLHSHASYAFHALFLDADADAILHSFHKNQIQQKIKKAGRVGLQIDNGRSEALLDDFYSLLLMTRRRHQLPPQPKSWFQALAKHFGDELTVWVARSEGRPIASILTLASSLTVVYKYGCSDPAFHNLGGMQALMWEAIQYAKLRGATLFDFGRSDLDNQGLITYKDQWGTQRTTVTYYRNRVKDQSHATRPFASGVARKLFTTLPDSCLVAAGRLLYRHMG